MHVDIFRAEEISVKQRKEYGPDDMDGFYFKIEIETESGCDVVTIHCKPGAKLDGVYPAVELKGVA